MNNMHLTGASELQEQFQDLWHRRDINWAEPALQHQAAISNYERYLG